jgi:hypothetical protein
VEATPHFWYLHRHGPLGLILEYFAGSAQMTNLALGWLIVFLQAAWSRPVLGE